MIMTRWHLDDPIGRLIERFPAVKSFRYSAIAEEDERNRSKGEALFPEHKSLSFLLERKKAMTQASWESEYQQNPIVVGGGIFPIEKLTTMALLDRTNILKSVRYWDKAGTEDAGAYPAGVLIHMLKDKRFVIEHVVRGRWSALEREQHIKAWAERDRELIKGSYEIGVEQEPGSAGKNRRKTRSATSPATKCSPTRSRAPRRSAPSRSQLKCRAAMSGSSPALGNANIWTSSSNFRAASSGTKSTQVRARSTGSSHVRATTWTPLHHDAGTASLLA